jgi:hypothetical protein
MEKLKEFFKFWFRCIVILVAFAFLVWVVVTAGSYNEALGVLVAIIGVAGFVSLGIVYFDVG